MSDKFNDESIIIGGTSCELDFNIRARGKSMFIDVYLVQGNAETPTEYFIAENHIDQHIKALTEAKRRITEFKAKGEVHAD